MTVSKLLGFETFANFFNCFGFGECCFGKKVSVSVSEILVSEKRFSFVVGKFGIGKKVSVSVSVKILVSSFSDLNQVFLHLRHISDLCNSLPLEAESGQSLELKCSPGSHLNTSGKISQNQKPTFGEPLNCDLKSKDNDNQQKRSSGVYDFTPTNKQSSKEGLGREPSLACEVSSYFQEQ